MKKLELKKMENVQGGLQNRKCLILGGLTALACLGGYAAFCGAAMYTTAECV
ncbi:hypothetical protein [Flavobacterium sp.]|uniref:hypothetical protein n=1 Tax=Flavobacterium sp. TaxID=239 RepID=UPI00286E37D9|nr:hypothetical protein [Flavobacterium sp.]